MVWQCETTRPPHHGEWVPRPLQEPTARQHTCSLWSRHPPPPPARRATSCRSGTPRRTCASRIRGRGRSNPCSPHPDSRTGPCCWTAACLCCRISGSVCTGRFQTHFSIKTLHLCQDWLGGNLVSSVLDLLLPFLFDSNEVGCLLKPDIHRIKTVIRVWLKIPFEICLYLRG